MQFELIYQISFTGCFKLTGTLHSEETQWKAWRERQGSIRCKRSWGFPWSLQERDRNVHSLQRGGRDYTATNI